MTDRDHGLIRPDGSPLSSSPGGGTMNAQTYKAALGDLTNKLFDAMNERGRFVGDMRQSYQGANPTKTHFILATANYPGLADHLMREANRWLERQKNPRKHVARTGRKRKRKSKKKKT